MTAAAQSDRPYFAFEQEITPVPSAPTHCKCGAWLEPLRRYGGRCKACVTRPSAPTTQASVLVLVRWFYRSRRGHKERFVEVRCTCGRRRTLQWTKWQHHRPQCCNRCRLRGVERRGFEAELAR